MKKSIIALGSVLSTVAFATPAVYAQSTVSPSVASQVQSTYQSKYQSLLQDGLSQSDAQYYAKLTSEVKQLELTNQKIDLSNVQGYSQSAIAADPQGMRNKVLALDPQAIKGELESPIFTQGMSDLATLEKENPGQSQYDIQYPDGSSLVVTSTPGKTWKVHKDGTASTPQAAQSAVTPQGYQEHTTDSYWADNAGSGWSNTVKLFSGVSYSENSIFDLSYTCGSTDADGNYVPGQAYVTSFNTGGDFGGVVSMSGTSPSTQTDPEGTSLTQQGESQAFFTVSTSISLGGDGLSLGLSSGVGWTQYAILRVDGETDYISDVAATYNG